MRLEKLYNNISVQFSRLLDNMASSDYITITAGVWKLCPLIKHQNWINLTWQRLMKCSGEPWLISHYCLRRHPRQHVASGARRDGISKSANLVHSSVICRHFGSNGIQPPAPQAFAGVCHNKLECLFVMIKQGGGVWLQERCTLRTCSLFDLHGMREI